METIPVYARSGSIVPLRSGLLIFPGGDGTFTVYEDAGDGWGYENGEYTRITLQWDDTERTLTVGSPAGDYPEAPMARHVRARLVRPGQGWLTHTGYLDAEQHEGSLRLRL